MPGGTSLAFLTKKNWNAATLDNTRKVYEAEQEKGEEPKKEKEKQKKETAPS